MTGDYLRVDKLKKILKNIISFGKNIHFSKINDQYLTY